MKLFARLPYIGNIFFYHIYLYYEEPQLFSGITDTGQLYLISSLPEDNKSKSWLALPLSQGRLKSLENNEIEIRQAFLEPETFLWRIKLTEESYNLCYFIPELLTEDILPEPGEYLNFTEGQNGYNSSFN